MLLQRAGALLLATSAAHAYTQPSPFFLVSSEPLPHNTTLQSAEIAKTRDVEDKLIESLSDCTASRYHVVSQQGVSAEDFRSSSTGGGFSRTRKSLGGVKEGALVEIPYVGVLWEMDGERIVDRLREACEERGRVTVDAGHSQNADVVVIQHSTLSELPLDEKKRATVITQADKELDQHVQSVISGKDKSVMIYITTGASQHSHGGHSYDMDESYDSNEMHTDLKRDVYPRQSNNNSDEAQAGLPLFEKYQFFTPGLFMGFFVSVILLMLLYVGITAIAGLEVSYAAFSKEMGPQAQKSKQQ